jgi:hypothetical protein
MSAGLGIGLVKPHYIVKSLIDVGLIKLDNSQRSDNTWGCAYPLMPKGIKEKAAITVPFLARKHEDQRRLARELKPLKFEVDTQIESDRTVVRYWLVYRLC